MRDLYFIRLKGKSQLISCSVKAESIHQIFFKSQLQESLDELRYLTRQKDALYTDIEMYTKRILWSLIKAANKKTPGFENWSKQIGELTMTDATNIFNEISTKINTRKVR